MLDDAVLIEDAVEHGERAAAVDHVVLGDDLEPVDDGLLLEDMAIVRHAETDADAVIRESIEAICRHSRVLGEKVSSVPPQHWSNIAAEQNVSGCEGRA